MFFFFNDTATTEIYTLSLHDALPIWIHMGNPGSRMSRFCQRQTHGLLVPVRRMIAAVPRPSAVARMICARQRSEEHTSELQSRQYLVCRLLLEKKQIWLVKE